MDSEERKQRFIKLLSQMLQEENSTKSQLAQKLGIKPPTLTGWFQGKVDPANIEILIFERIAIAKNSSVDDLAKFLSLFDNEFNNPVERFKKLITEKVAETSLDQLGQKLKISKNTIGGWLNPGKSIDPGKLSIGTIAILAKEQGWTIEQLLIYLGLREPVSEKDLILKVQSQVFDFSLIAQVEILNWLSGLVEQKIKYSTNLEKIDRKNLNEKRSTTEKSFNILRARTVCLILEKEDLAIASNYASNLAIHLNLKPENIKVTTIPNLPESIAEIDILIFDISSPSSATIAVVEDIKFDRDIVVFANADLPVEVRSSLEDKVTDLVVKPIDWQNLKNKAYFC